VSRRAWEAIRDRCTLELPQVAERALSDDGTIKYALEMAGAAVEAVLIPGRGRSTLCVSSQAGCSRRCAFCATGRLGLGRNLAPQEIVGEYLVTRGDAPERAPLRNLVFMGMGEPMDNLDAVLTAIEILTQSPAPQLSAGHITVSTAGVAPGMKRFLSSCQANLAISLNATRDDVRERLMAHDRAWPIAELMTVLRDASQRQPGRLFFVEYVMFDRVNDGDGEARELLDLLKGVNARVNLIPHNPFPDCDLRPPPMERIHAFQTAVLAGGVRCMVRTSRGQEISAACGQLALRRARTGVAT